MLTALFGKDKEEKPSEYGVSRFQDKKELIANNSANTTDVEALRRQYLETKKELNAEASKTWKGMVKAVTPGFIIRYNNKKVHLQELVDNEGKFDSATKVYAKTTNSDYKHFLKEKEKSARVAKRIADAQYQRDQVKVVVDQAKVDMALHEIEDYKKRRALMATEQKIVLDAEKKARADKEKKEMDDLRVWRMNFWAKQAKEKHEEAQIHVKNNIDRVNNEYQSSLDRTAKEWSDRELARAQLQVEGNDIGGPVGLPGSELGVFGVPMGDGQYRGILEDAGHHEGVDDADVKVFDAFPYTVYETNALDLVDKEAAMAKSESLYDALQSETQYLNSSVSRMVQLREGIERDKKQIDNEQKITQINLDGPPQRLPNAKEITTINIRKERSFKLARQIGDLQYSIDVASGKNDVMKKQMLSIAKEIASLRGESKSMKEDLDGLNGGLGMLPVVVGRNISKVFGNGPMAQPKEYTDAITHQSRAVEFKAISKKVLKEHKDRNALDQGLWLARQQGSETRIEAERVITKLADIQDRLKAKSLETAKVNLYEAINLFGYRKIPLDVAHVKYTGVLPWWTSRDYRLSSNNLEMYGSDSTLGGLSFEPEDPNKIPDETYQNGITLGEDTSGFCLGVFDFPKNGLWELLIPISLSVRSEDDDEPGNENDFISIRIGPTLGSMTYVGTYYNKINPDTGSVLYDVKHVMRGKKCAFRFDFSSSTSDKAKHLAVGTGLYEEFTMKALEQIPDPKNRGRERLISSYVKTIKIENMQQSMYETKLLEELISLEDCESKHWDSTIITKYPQRYSREFFLRILRAEILCEIKRNKALAKEELNIVGKSKITEKEAKLEWSRGRYVARKRALQQHVVDKGMDLIGKRLEVYDDVKNTWRHTVVVDCKVQWVENGLVAKTAQVMQEYTEYNDAIGDPFTADLSKVNYFPSPVQVVDDELLKKWKQKKAWEDRLKEINRIADVETHELRNEYQTYSEKLEEKFKKDSNKANHKFNTTAESDAENYCNTSAGMRRIKVHVASCLLDMKRGLVKLEPKEKPKIVAQKLGKEKTLLEFVDKRKADLKSYISGKESDMVTKIKQKLFEYKRCEEYIMEEFRSEKIRLDYAIKEQRDADVARHKARVKFDPVAFEKCVPKAQLCEHLKSKAWGNSYSKGVKCSHCGKELTELHQEESQVLGYGTGTSKEVFNALKRHRDNEQSFRFKNAAELDLMESERVRLEKERRIMDINESYFYDFQDLKVIYDIDRRHARLIKDSGKFRQGLQWTEQELEIWEIKQILAEKERISKSAKVESITGEYDALSSMEEPPPTFRAVDERHHAQYVNMMFLMGRLHNYQKKITGLKEVRLDLLSERTMFSRIIESLHKTSFNYENTLLGFEDDISRCDKLLSTFEKMRQMWQQSKRILKHADVSLRKTHIKRVGVWDDVKDQFDIYSFLHDETRQLLKLKFLIDVQLEEHVAVSRKKKLLSGEAEIKWKIAEEDSIALEYCTPGHPVYTRYGEGYIRTYRHLDRMLCISLPFGTPPAKVWMNAREIIDAERAKQRSEILLMDIEDVSMHKVISFEKIQIRKELYLMEKNEEGLKELYEFFDLGKNEDEQLFNAVDSAIRSGFKVTQMTKYLAIQNKLSQDRSDVIVNDKKRELKRYKGPAAGKPKIPTKYEIYKMRKEIGRELDSVFIIGFAKAAEIEEKESMITKRSDWILNYSFELLINHTVAEMILEIAQDSYSEGLIAKASAEKKSGIIFNKPNWIQFSIYATLADIWKRRKEELRIKIELNKGLSSKMMEKNAKPELDLAALQKAKMLRRLRRIEKARQKEMNDNMEREEELSRTFYLWELKENLRERRQMRVEDGEALARRKAEEEALLAQASAYVISAADFDEASKGTKETGYDARRMQLKELTLERRRRAEEQAHMIIEDKMGAALREIVRAEIAKKAYEAEFGADPDADSGDEVDEGAMIPAFIVRVPKWLNIIWIDDWDEWDPMRQKKYIEKAVEMRDREKEIEKKLRKEERIFDRLEDKSYIEWQETFSTYNQDEMVSQLNMLETEEESKEYEAELHHHQNNMKKIMIFCREKGEQELHAKTRLRKKEELARRRDKDCEEAQAWYNLCLKRSRQRDKLKRKVQNDCLFIDTDSITGFHQRFGTALLRIRLFEDYFREIVISIINRAETIATERRLMDIQENLSSNKVKLDERTVEMKRLWGEIQRDDLLRMRRSELNKKFFGKHRTKTLQERFGSWVRYFYWNRGHREAFEMKYEVLKRQIDIERQFKQQLNPDKVPTYKAKELGGKNAILTPIQKHRERIVQCKKCMLQYLDSQNNSIACMYHGGKFETACPSYCSNPGLTALCPAHRMRRWRCCDNTIQKCVGCMRTYHSPPDSDPIYDKIMNKVNERDAYFLNGLDERIDKARKENWQEKAFHLKRGMIFKIEDNITADRETAASFKNIKWE
jgi:hypothetical protein